MESEGTDFDKKSLRVLTRAKPDWDALACDCVCFANGQGGRLLIGIEDDVDVPAPNQKVSSGLVDIVSKRIRELTINVQVLPRIVTAENGGQFLELVIARAPGVASTSDGRYFLRVSDTCQPILGDDVLRLADERPGFSWELSTSLRVSPAKVEAAKLKALVAGIRTSDRVKASVKAKTNDELLRHYGLVIGDYLTNLGILVVGKASDRARLGTAPVIQFLKYDEVGNKVNKMQWDDYELSPLEMLDAVWREVPDFRESYELPAGMFRRSMPAFDEKVIRELLVNALVHRPYTQRGDIFFNLHPEHLEVVNPGRLPLGVTPRNILRASRRRNDGLARIFHDLQLMEKEGSGFDLLYDRLLSSGRPAPVLSEGRDRVSVTIQRRIIRPDVIGLLAQADGEYQLSQRERITLGVLAIGDGLTARELARELEAESIEEMRSWIGRLPDFGLVGTSGKTRGLRYFVAPEVLRNTGVLRQTTLRRIPQHRLLALLHEDLSRYPNSSSSEINRRIGAEISAKTVKRALDELIGEKKVIFAGQRRWRRYRLADQPLSDKKPDKAGKKQ